MKLLTKEIINKMPPLYTYDGKEPKDVPVVVKFFAPWGNWTWYTIEGEKQENGDWMFFGLVVGLETELGYFTLNELESVRGPFGLKIERDRHFSGTLADVQIGEKQ
jgi:hypothetical protein